MRTKRKRFLELLCPVLFLALVLVGSTLQAQEIGKLVDKSNWQEFESLLAPAQLRAARDGEWTFQTGNFRFPYKHWDKFLSATEKNAGKYDVDKSGVLIDKATGKYPNHNVYGMPFPQIDPKDPNVAQKIMWNFKFVLYRKMGAESPDTGIRWVAKTGREDRYFRSATYDLYYQGRQPGHEIAKNPDGFLYLYMSSILQPMDLKNTNAMTWEYWDLRESVVYSYVPVIRRVRRGTGALRSDPYMGSDSWTDAKDGFAGKNQSFTFKLLGERMLLAAIDTLDKKVVPQLPDGTIIQTNFRKYGFETPGWKGAPWAQTSMYWVPRPVWVIEGMPLDPYYAWGKHIFWVDKENYYLIDKEVYDKAGEFQHWHQYAAGFAEVPSGNNTLGTYNCLTALDTKAQHASAITPDAYHVFMPITSKMRPSFFSMANFLQMSK